MRAPSPIMNGGAPLVCPICSEQMVTLLQLNRHLDDVHREVEEEEKDDVKTWFRKQMLKAKQQFQPVVALNQKLKGLDIFESNATLTPSPPSNGIIYGNGSGSTSNTQDLRDPDELVTRAHWQRSTSNDYCLEPTCRKPLGVVNGSVNCRKCGKLFCEEHTMYQIKLSRSAQHEPVRGFWCRVCETCFKSREGYNDHNGLVRDHTQEFFQWRRKTVDRAYLDVTRLEKRLTKLTQLLTNPPETDPSNNGYLWPVGLLKNQRRQLEQKVVAWEDDNLVTNCPYCKQTFSKLGIRKHHCRLCGKVVCGDLRTECSSEVGLNVPPLEVSTTLSEKQMNGMSLDVRICKECKNTLFSKKDFAVDVAARPPDVRAYSSLVQFEQGILTMMPRFQKLLVMLQNPHQPPPQATISEAHRTRKRLLDAFSQYEASAKRILNLSTTSPTQLTLQKNIYQAAAAFLQMHMLPLKALPKVIKTRPPGAGAAGMIKTNTSPGIGSGSSSVTSGDPETEQEREKEKEEKRIREQLIVLEEQKFLVEGMVENARRRRRLDEVGALMQSVRELDEEIERVGGELEALGV
ncbi:FYVE zinc finger-domain-containing protein [Kalaharituber pfeilii]|nr:FYVE zinc finger-domain-containing protein [Kalaharituber pfeilii]